MIEFEEAQKIANSQSEMYARVTNILLALLTIVFTSLFNLDDQGTRISSGIKGNAFALAVLFFVFGGILLRYFVDLQQQITINGRKVVTLRTLLGLDYGHIHLTLPNWRVEGANNPFVIKYFNGWLNFKSMPFWVLTVSMSVMWFWINNDGYVKFESIDKYWMLLIGDSIILMTYVYIYRTHLYDRHETNYLAIAKIVCSFLRVKLLDNLEYIIYRAKLSYLELNRLEIDYELMSKILVSIEDREFYVHNGVSLKALIRAGLSRTSFLRKRIGLIESGGSTIVMQLSRALFVPSDQNKYLRKVGEILLAPWINGQFDKKEIISLYVACVRYEKGVIGLAQAIKYFFGDLKQHVLTAEESFFLVERLSNITSTVNWDRVKHLILRSSLKIDRDLLLIVYLDQVKAGRLKPDSNFPVLS